MTTLFYILMVLAPVALFATAFIAVKNRFSGKSIKKPLKMNIAVFAVLVVLISVLFYTYLLYEYLLPVCCKCPKS